MPRRELLSHQPNTATQQLSIHATDDPGAGGANHRYVISGYDCTTNPSGDPRVLHDTPIVFQNGVLKEAGANGVTNEALLAVVEDRLAAFQVGKFACAENADALAGVRHAIDAMNRRTARRVEAGIEGTHEEDSKPDSTGLGDRFVEGKPEGDDEPLSKDAKKLYDENFVETDEETGKPKPVKQDAIGADDLKPKGK